MFRILKYPIGYEKGKPYGWVPEGKCIRIDWVDDIEYKGYWCWLIVDCDKEPKFEKRFLDSDKPNDVKDSYVVQLGVLEEQTVETEMDTEAGFVFLSEGKIFLVLEKDWVLSPDKKHKIVGYKTGQEFNIHPQNMDYLGFVPLIIKNEIAIYFFRVFD
jgi:hypothetical protein